MSQRRRHAILAGLLAILVAAPAAAESRSARMTVSVQVVARALVTIDARPDVVVTEADLARGYVEVAQPLQLRVRTNSPAGYLLQVAKTNEAFSSVELEFGNTTMNVSQESWVARPRVEGGEIVTMKMRVRLGSNATAGRHQLPVEVSALPL